MDMNHIEPNIFEKKVAAKLNITIGKQIVIKLNIWTFEINTDMNHIEPKILKNRLISNST